MHDTALYYGKLFFETYCRNFDGVVYDIGSLDVNGSLKTVCPPNMKYVGLDFVKGKGVDIVIDDPYEIPLGDEVADVIVSSSCFEHSEFFWLTYLEIIRILKPGGYFYLNAPTNGNYHRFPVDCWRFYPDSGMALVNWAKSNSYPVELMESFTGERSDEDLWNDFVAVFRKSNVISSDNHFQCLQTRIIDSGIKYSNGILGGREEPLNFSERSYEYILIKELKEEVSQLQLSNDQLQLSNDQLQLSNDQLQLSNDQLHVLATELLNSNSWRLTAPLRFISQFLQKLVASSQK